MKWAGPHFLFPLCAVLFLACVCTVHAQTASQIYSSIGRSSSQPIAIEVTPAPKETYRITSKHTWRMTPGNYQRNRFAEVEITDKDQSDFALYFMLTNAQMEEMQGLVSKRDFEAYLRKLTEGLLPQVREKEIPVYDFNPAGRGGCFTVLHAKDRESKEPFSTVEVGICRIGENCILSYKLSRKDALDPETRINLYKLLVSLSKEEIPEPQSRHRFSSARKVWDAAIDEFAKRLGGYDKLSAQYPFQISYLKGRWVVAGQEIAAAREDLLELMFDPQEGASDQPDAVQTVE